MVSTSRFVKVYEDIRLVFILGEFLYNVTFTYAPRTLNKQCHFSVPFLLPIKELLIYFSLHSNVLCTFLRYSNIGSNTFLRFITMQIYTFLRYLASHD